ncbi:CAP domain-containing protein [Streptomyces sp. H27-D2]|uniref:CAP domain-containing protein n=1 Tax=Streptomyces sp. H27-D2 TaxID=3046304 RepID=UPI002DB61121|nr:CAP domain-containing protein [Streptomyces sp. H27-D2]MEC4017845.1 CAP domain-containing protein [Streptomyces sp. H27-D2]
MSSNSSRHGRRRSLPVRKLVLAAGALTVVAGAGVAIAMPDDSSPAARTTRTAANRVASSASPMAEEATRTSSPSASASPSRSSTKPTAAKKSASATRNAAPSTPPKRTKPVAPPRRTTKAAPAAAPVATGEVARILQLVNKERATAGCRPLSADARLNRAAQSYTDSMAATGELSHTGPDGVELPERVKRVGFTWSAVGENIARGQTSAESVMDSWMKSPGHRANILNCDYRDLGVGVHRGDGGPWWTQDFATER